MIVKFLSLAAVIVTAAAVATIEVPVAFGAHVCPFRLATVPVGPRPIAAAVNPNTNRIYVANLGGETVSVIDGATNLVIATIPVGVKPVGVGVNPVTDRVYVSNLASGTVSVIDGTTNTVVNTIPVFDPGTVGIDQGRNRIYVAGFDTFVIDGSTDTIVARVPGDGGSLSDLAVNPVTNRVYVGSTTGRILVIDGATVSVTASIATGSAIGVPVSVAVNPTANRIYAASLGPGGQPVSLIIDGATNAIIGSLAVGPAGLGYLGIDAPLDRVYAPAVGYFYVFDGTGAAAGSELFGFPGWRLAVNETTHRVYVTNPDGEAILVVGDPPPGYDTSAPSLGLPTFSLNPKPVGQGTLISAAASDDVSGIAKAEYFLGDDPGVGKATPMAVRASELSSQSEIGSGLAPGVYPVGVRARDFTCNWSETALSYLVVYDPNDGFATGAGHIVPGASSSDPGDLLPGLDGASRAHFAFVVKYQKGSSTVPGGDLQFHYKVGDFHLQSAGMDWLVVTNANWARFQGTATIDGTGGLFGFRVDARDGDPTGQADRFVIRIYAPGSDPNAAEPIYKASGDVFQGQVQIHR
jgi:YVTN family beta-propeller protein